MKKNDIVIETCEGLSYEGYGVVRPEGLVVFVRALLPGERAEIQLTKIGARQGYGRIRRILEPSPDRIEPDCPAFPRCGGCALRHLSYPAELAWKHDKVEEALRKIGSCAAEVEPTLEAQHPLYYRNKAQAPVQVKDGKLCWGFYRVHSHDLIPVRECRLEDFHSSELLNELADRIPAQEGEHLRHILVRCGKSSGEYMIAVVSSREDVPLTRKELLSFGRSHPEVKSILLNIQDRDTNVILGEKDILLQGEDHIRDALCGLEYSISAHSFYQVHPAQAQRLYSLAMEYAGLTEKETVLDLYCGIGTITLLAARRAKEAIGIEVVPDAVENARENARSNHVENARFLCMDASEGARKLEEEGKKIDVVIVDPPRRGMDERAREAIASIGPGRIVYVSCNPSTLARDIAWLQERSYRVERARPVDMFPRSAHVETVVLMSRVK